MPGTHTNKAGYYGSGSSVVAKPAHDGEGGTRRLSITSDKLVERPFEGIDTVADVVPYTARTHGGRNAIGWRDVVKVHTEEREVEKEGKKEKKKWTFWELSKYKWVTYTQFEEMVGEVKRGLVEVGVKGDGEGERIFNIYSQTSLNWQLLSQACAAVGIPVATAYDTLGESGLAHSLNEPQSVGIFTNADLLPTLLTVFPNTPSVKFVVYDGEPEQDVLDKLAGAREGVQVLSLDELRKRGRESKVGEEDMKKHAPKPSDLALIMYTSGSTGPPKGVLITHANLIASVGAVYYLLGHHLTKDDAYLAYLPLAHVLEYIVELIMLFVGMPIGYGRVKTLTDASVRNCKGDIVEFKPSIMCGVPAVWEQIRKGILAKVNSSGALRKSVFNSSMSVKKSNVPVLSTLADVVLNGVKAATGGRLRIALSGGAALSKETQEFLHVALVTIVQGYGMTESCGMCAILPPEMMQYTSVGLPVPSVEIKLLDVPDAGYTSKGKDASKGEKEQGEVCIRGPSVTNGYYKRPDLNEDKEIFPGDGWLRTGDVGQWNDDGTLSLIDRIKNLVKLSGGEYIALERLEATYKSCNLVANICVHATAEVSKPVAIVIPNEVHLREALGGDKRGLGELCEDKKVHDLVLKEINGLGKKNAFKPMELLSGVVLTSEEWTPENGLVTAAQKVQRKAIQKRFEGEIGEAFKKSG